MRLLSEHLGGNVDRHIGRDGRRRSQQDSHFLARAAAELDQGRARRKEARHVTRPLAQELELAAGQIIFRQGRDLLEQLRAGLVVEVFGREPLGPCRQAGDDVARERGRRLGDVVANSSLNRRSHDSLRSSPEGVM